VKVEVGIETSGPATDERLATLKSAAACFTDNAASISVTDTAMPDRHSLVTRFTMRTVAQYKVVDDIARGFKMAIWDFDDYIDIWIAFPKSPPKPRKKPVVTEALDGVKRG